MQPLHERLETTRLGWRVELRELVGGSFLRSVGVLAGGTFVAQLLAVCALPFLTRLYSPEDFRLLAVYLSVMTMISVAGCLRFDIAIPIPEREEDGAQLLALALGASATVAALVGTSVFIWPEQIAHALGQPGLRPYLWLLPLGIWMSTSFSAFQYWTTRRKRFSTLARIRVTQVSTGIGAQVGLGAAGIAPFGLLFGHMLYGGAGALALARQAWQRDPNALRAIRWPEMKRVLKDYQRFPKLSTLEAIANYASIQLPIILIAALAAGPEAGLLLLATRVMDAPLQLVGSAVGQIYLSRAPEEMRRGQLRRFTQSILCGLAAVGVVPILIAALSAPPLFALAFGDEWRRAGVLVQWMTPWLIFQFLASPVSMLLHVTGHQVRALALQLGGLLLRPGAVLLAWLAFGRFEAEAYIVSGAIFYGVYILVILHSFPRECIDSESAASLPSNGIAIRKM